MLARATRRQPITHLVVTIAVFACSKPKAPAPRDAPAAAAPDAAPAPVDATSGGITIRFKDKPAPGSTLARRCVLGGDPLASDCVGGGVSLARGADGRFYVVAGKQVRRYQRVPGADCRLEPSGAPIELPAEKSRPQELGKGPVYMRSGGPAWHLVRAGTALYAFDFLGGMVRIDRGKPELACDVFGYRSAAALGKRMLVARHGIEELRLGTHCKAASARIDDKARGDVYVVGDQLFVANGSDVTRYDDKTPVALGGDTKPCYVSSMTACGDGACAVDSNCKQVIQYGHDGKVLRTLDDDRLFESMPWSLHDAVTTEGGDVLLLARHRDTTNGKEICEAAIYELPAAVFTL